MSALLELIIVIKTVTTMRTAEGTTAAATLAMHWPPMATRVLVSSCIISGVIIN